MKKVDKPETGSYLWNCNIIMREGDTTLFEIDKEIITRLDGYTIIPNEQYQFVTKQISIGIANEIGKDELWCMWYKCPNCEETNIAPEFKFCPDCGSQLMWEVEKMTDPTES